VPELCDEATGHKTRRVLDGCHIVSAASCKTWPGGSRTIGPTGLTRELRVDMVFGKLASFHVGLVVQPG